VKNIVFFIISFFIIHHMSYH